MTILNQFKHYLENQINNPMYADGEEEREVPFTSYDDIKEDSIFLVVTSGSKEYTFEYNCYQDLGNTQLYDFELLTA